jgi:glycosyltransferase involved in cell wall biosynthesis
VSEKRRIAVFAHALHDHRPRGVQRVARAVTEELLDLLPPDTEFCCLIAKVGRQPELTYQCCDLRGWLACNPLIKDENLSLQERLQRLVRRLANLTVPPGIVRGFDRLRAKVDRAVHALPGAKKIQNRWRSLTRLLSSGSLTHNLPTHWITLDEIDAVISFEAFDDIWNEPTHRCRTRMICWIHDTIPKRINEGPYWNPDAFDRAVTNACYRAQKLVCVSQSTERDLLTFYPLARDKTHVIHLGHDLARFERGAAADRVTVDAMLRKFGISPDLPFLLYVGAMERRKNTANILQACEIVRRQNPRLNFQLVFVGDTSHHSATAQMLQRKRQWLPIHVLRYAADEDVAILAGQARAFLFPSLWEGFGIPLLEAMTAGAPVVTSDTSSMPEVCGPHAMYCDPYDPYDMADKFLHCLTMDARERRQHVGVARVYSSQFTWQKSAQALLALVEDQINASQEAGRDADSVPLDNQRYCA